MRSPTPSVSSAAAFSTYGTRAFDVPRYYQGHTSLSERDERDEVHIKKEKDCDDELMITPRASPVPNHYDRGKRTRSSCLPNLNRPLLPSSANDRHPYDDQEHYIRKPDSRFVEVHDDDRMSIQETNDEGRENGDGKSDSTEATIRNLPMSPISETRAQDMEEGDFDVARTAEYQSGVFEMLEEICTDAARRYWQGVASQGRFCLPVRTRDSRAQVRDGHHYYGLRAPAQPVRTSRWSERSRMRHRFDPYPVRDSRFIPRLERNMRSIYDFYGLHSPPRDEDTRMSVGLNLLESPNRSDAPPPKFLDLISKITNHIWRTEHSNPLTTHRAEFTTARKCWDMWRLAEVVVCAADGVVSEGHGGSGFDGVVRGREEVIGIVEAAGELCVMFGDEVGRRRCEQFVLDWVVDAAREELEEGEIVE